MTPGDIIVLTALLVVLLVGMALLVSGIGLLIRAFTSSGAAPVQHDDRRPWQVERLVYRHHRTAGTLITLGSAYFLGQSFHGPLATDGNTATPLTMFWWTLVGAHACTLLIGLVILIKPSRLKSIESLANRRYELGLAPTSLNTGHRPALHGLLVSGIAIVVLVGMSLLLLERIGWTA